MLLHYLESYFDEQQIYFDRDKTSDYFQSHADSQVNSCFCSRNIVMSRQHMPFCAILPSVHHLQHPSPLVYSVMTNDNVTTRMSYCNYTGRPPGVMSNGEPSLATNNNDRLTLYHLHDIFVVINSKRPITVRIYFDDCTSQRISISPSRYSRVSAFPSHDWGVTAFIAKRQLECVLASRKQRDGRNMTSSMSLMTRPNTTEAMTYYWRFINNFGDFHVRMSDCDILERLPAITSSRIRAYVLSRFVLSVLVEFLPVSVEFRVYQVHTNQLLYVLRNRNCYEYPIEIHSETSIRVE
jgi:hypothetical protein